MVQEQVGCKIIKYLPLRLETVLCVVRAVATSSPVTAQLHIAAITTHFTDKGVDKISRNTMGTNLLFAQPKFFFLRNPSGTFRDIHW